MKPKCPYCSGPSESDETRISVIKDGQFRRSSDSKLIQRFRCSCCGRRFSNATFNLRRYQKKRAKNHLLRGLLASGVSMRRAARLTNLSRTTVARKAIYLGRVAEMKLEADLKARPPATHVQFDDQETFEHTKLKPLSVTLVVEHPTRRILGFEVAQMPAKGLLAKKSVRKYGRRRDERGPSRRRLFSRLRGAIAADAVIESDENPHYPADVLRHFPKAEHRVHKGQRGSIVGQGELKRIRWDPLFSLNHTCAMNRYACSRLIRRTWNTTKIPERLRLHLAICAEYHNSQLSRP